MLGIRGTREIRLVTRVAGRRSGSVVVIRMALRALQCCVHSGQRIVRIQGVIEIHARPCGGVMTGVAGGREGDGRVVWIGGVLEVGLVTTKAVRWQCAVVVVGMALRAGNCCMGTG